MKPTHRHSELACRRRAGEESALKEAPRAQQCHSERSEESSPANKRQFGRGARFTRTGTRQQRGTLSCSVGQTFLSAYSFMKRLAHLRWIAVAASTGLLLTLAACGGSGSGSVGGTPPPTLTITTTSLPDGNLSQSYSATLQASGGTGARAWSITTGSLPDGLSLDGSTGVISGTPTVDATFNFTVQVADSGSPQQVATRVLSILIRIDAVTITTTSLPDGRVGVPYSQFVSATNGQQPFSWSISAGALPTGLSIDPNTGEVGGLPTTQGTFNFTVQVTDELNDTATAALSIVIASAPSLAITTTALPDGVMDVPYQVKLHAAGGQPPLAWSIVSGSGNLPSGLTLGTTTGEISGTPAAAVTESFTVQVTDSTSPTMQTASQPLVLTINSALAGRNDDIGSATALPGTITARASISPYTDPVNTTPANPDVDVYEITASAGSIVEIRICALSLTDPRCTLTTPSPLDSVIEIVDMNGVRFTTGCRNEGTDDGVTGAVDTTPTLFDDTCLNDDITLGVVQDSKLEFQVPGSGTVTFYVRVLGFRGDARPDLLYDIIISGAN